MPSILVATTMRGRTVKNNNIQCSNPAGVSHNSANGMHDRRARVHCHLGIHILIVIDNLSFYSFSMSM